MCHPVFSYLQNIIIIDRGAVLAGDRRPREALAAPRRRRRRRLRERQAADGGRRRPKRPRNQGPYIKDVRKNLGVLDHPPPPCHCPIHATYPYYCHIVRMSNVNGPTGERRRCTWQTARSTSGPSCVTARTRTSPHPTTYLRVRVGEVRINQFIYSIALIL